MVKPIQGTVTLHDTKVKGSSFKTSADIEGAGKVVHSPFAGKVAHVYKDKTRCGNPGLDSCQIILSEEVMVPKGHSGDLTRKLTGRRIALAHFVPVSGLSKDPLRHIQEGTVLGIVSGDTLHVAVNKPEMLSELTS